MARSPWGQWRRSSTIPMWSGSGGTRKPGCSSQPARWSPGLGVASWAGHVLLSVVGAGKGASFWGTEWAQSPEGWLTSACRRLCPLETRFWPPWTRASGVRSAKSSGRPTGQQAGWAPGWGPRRCWGRRLGVHTCLCLQPARGHGPGWCGNLHQRLRQPPRAPQSPRQGGPGDHGHHQGKQGQAGGWSTWGPCHSQGSVC